MTTRSVVECLSCCFQLEDCCFNEGRSRTESCSHAAAGIPNVSHGNVRNEKTESYGIWRHEDSEQSAVPAAVWGIFHNFAFPELLEK